jgi:hypothetical protein
MHHGKFSYPRDSASELCLANERLVHVQAYVNVSQPSILTEPSVLSKGEPSHDEVNTSFAPGSTGLGTTLPESGATASIQALSSVIIQVLERAPEPLLPPVQGQIGLFVRYLRRKPGRGLVIVYRAGALNVRQAAHRRAPERRVTVTLDEAALAGSQIRFNVRQLEQARLEVQESGILKIADLSLVVQVFPADNGLPTLALSCTTSKDGPLFTALEAAARAHLSDPDWHLSSAKAELVRYKPSSRCVLRYALQLEKGVREKTFHREVSLFGKLYSDPEKAHTLQANIQRLYAERAQVHLPIMPRPLSIVETLGLTLNEAVQSAEGTEPEGPRTGLQALQPRFIRGRDGEILDAVIPDKEMSATAHVLARLHTSTVRPAGPPRTGPNEAKRAIERATVIATHCPAHAEALQRLAKQLATRLESLQPEAYRPAHGGFKPSQLLFCGQRVFALDMDGFCLADPALDVGYFLAYLRPSGLWYNRSGMRPWFEGAAASFVDAYRQALREYDISETTICDILQRAGLYEAAILFKIATRRVNRLNSPRPGELSAMLAEIKECLSDGN